MSLLGWSLGGIYAREVAKRLEGRVRQVITIGTPFGGAPEQNNLRWLFGAKEHDHELAYLRNAPDVPTTSIFSRSDGVVAWQSCVHDGAQHQTENIEVEGSHCGLGWNPEVLSIIADRLSHTEKNWKRHSRLPGPKRTASAPDAVHYAAAT
jgi:pimeloyl-ACP methyl ester carboxylesterase